MLSQAIKICQGPGCKAWASDQIAQDLIDVQRGMNNQRVRICRVPCMKVCGGGASVKLNSHKEVVKLREPDGLLNILGIDKDIFVAR